MRGLEAALKSRLKRLKVRVDNPDGDTFVLRNVPADARHFSKPQTSVLVKRPGAGMPFVVCVDEDLEYRGPDLELACAFAAGACRQGWRAVWSGPGVYSEARDAVEQALAMLGTAPSTKAGREGSHLSRFAANLTAEVRGGSAPFTVGQEEPAEQAAAGLLSWQRRLAVLSGPSGSGKSNLLCEVARRLNRARPDWQLLSVDLSQVFAVAPWEGEREKLLNLLLDEAAASATTAVVLEHAELAASLPLAPWLIAGALDRGARLAATCLPSYVEKLAQDPLARRIDLIENAGLGREEAAAALDRLRETLTAHHGVIIDSETIEAAVARSLTLAGTLPDKAIALLDAAAARAALLKQAAVTECDIYLAASRMRET